MVTGDSSGLFIGTDFAFATGWKPGHLASHRCLFLLPTFPFPQETAVTRRNLRILCLQEIGQTNRTGLPRTIRNWLQSSVNCRFIALRISGFGSNCSCIMFRVHEIELTTVDLEGSVRCLCRSQYIECIGRNWLSPLPFSLSFYKLKRPELYNRLC